MSGRSVWERFEHWPFVREKQDEGPMLETLDYTIRIGSIPTILYFDMYNIVCLKCRIINSVSACV